MNEAVAEQPAAETAAPAFAVPQISYSSAPALEVRPLGGGGRITQRAMLDELLNLGADWRLETTHELFALRSPLTHKNALGAHSYDDTIKRGDYWAAETVPGVPGARVVVGFGYGDVGYYDGAFRAFARAVRVSGQ